MACSSRIEWTHSSWNPVTGCSRVSAGCAHCYAERMAKRLQGMRVAKYRNGFEVTLHPDVLEDPLKWKKPQLIFVNSMSDLFHEQIPIAYLRQIFDVMRRADWHIFQILTKRAERLAELSPRIDWPPNVWMGVTVESARFTHRIGLLRQSSAAIKWLSMEPLLSAVPDMDLAAIDWIVVGGESGPGARPMKKEWVVDIKRQCDAQNVHFFFKQWGGVNKKKTGRKLNGRFYDAMPPLPEPAGQFTFGL
ncbi:MAG: phage Gp37/Gp68 family protein [Candidatus Zixiibacteriota bacterium]